jgi:hypothetical protein
MAYLAVEEFTEAERNGRIVELNWPDWHFGVLLLYGQNIAMNHLIATNQLNLIRLMNYIDFPSDSDVSVFDVLHIHVFHGNNMFSKFDYESGLYNNMSLADFDPLNQTPAYKYNRVKWFSLRIALEGKRTEPAELYNMLVNKTSQHKT